jgi:hypothetical protein
VAWERQGNRLYFYLSRRVGSRVVRDFFGDGPEARVAAALVEERRLRRLAHRRARQADRKLWESACRPLLVLAAVSDVLARAALMAGGYHQHACGEWRKRRGRH